LLTNTDSGVNDIQVPIVNGSDSYFMFNNIGAFSLLVRGSEYPITLHWLAKMFPNLMNKTPLGPSLKMMVGFDQMKHKFRAQFLQNSDTKIIRSNSTEFVDQVVVPAYVNSFKSIKRDFQGIPIMVALQAMSNNEVSYFNNTQGQGYYNRFFKNSREILSGYMNDDWHFVNVHNRLSEIDEPYISLHLGNEGHEMVSEILANSIEPIIKLEYQLD